MQKRPNGLEWGWIAWGLLALVMTVLVALAPTRHTVTGAYRGAAAAWVQQRDLYELGGIHGFLYLPQAAITFVPVLWLPPVLGEIVWRLPWLVFLAWGVWRLAATIQALSPRLTGLSPWFLSLTLTLIPCTLSSARNGQTNLPFAAALIWLALALLDRRWNRALLLLLFLVVLKPTAIVPVLLVGALWPAMRLRLAAGMLGLFLSPFLIDFHWGYVARQYALCWQKLALAREPLEHGFCDFSGMLWTFLGHPIPEAAIQGIAAVMALVVLGLSLRALRADPRLAPFWVVALAAAYLMLFNPRTETNSYVILGATVLPFLADAAAGFRRIEAGLLTAGIVLLGSDSYGKPVHPWTHLWLKALLALLFLGYVAVRLARGRALFANAPDAPHPTGR